MATTSYSFPRAFEMESLESRLLLSLTTPNPLADVTVLKNAAATQINVSSVFSDTQTAVRITTDVSTFATQYFDVLLYDTQTPLTVANFLSYVTSGAYDTTFIHRSIPGFVIQGGGYMWSTLAHIATDPPVTNEPGISNLRGTIAMAKSPGDPNSATSEWFINLANNAANLDNQNGGFTVFGYVIGSGMTVVDAIASLTIVDGSDYGGAFTDLPVWGAGSNQYLVTTTMAKIPKWAATGTSWTTLSIAGNSNPALVTPSLSGGTLSLNYTSGAVGTSSITLRATDMLGNTRDEVFDVFVRQPASNIIVTTSGVTTTEAGGTASFTIRLGQAPTADVTIGLSSSDTTEGTVSPASVTFTPLNWSTPQTVTVTGVNDAIVDGTVGYNIITAAAVSADAAYNTVNAADVSLTNTDNDTASVIVTPTSGLVTTELGGTATFTVRLGTQPSANVSIGISSGDLSEGTVSAASLTFTTANWSTPQTITITGADDLIADGNVAYTIITQATSSADPFYNGVAAADVSVTNNNDNDAVGITVTPTSGLQTSESGNTDSFTIVLESMPVANVSIPITVSDPTEGFVLTKTVVFSPSNYNMPQTVTVCGVDDVVGDGSVTYAIFVGPASSADGGYNGLRGSTVAVTNSDDESPATPVGYWPMNDGAGTLATDSGSGASSGTLTGNVTWTAGQMQSGVSMAGDGAYISVPTNASLDMTDTITIGVYVKQDAAPTGPQVILKRAIAGQAGFTVEYYAAGGGYRMGLFINGTWRWSSAVPIVAGQWTHLGFTYDGTKIQAYQNGLLYGAAVAQTGAITPASGTDLWIGRDVANSAQAARYFNGAIDEAIIYGTALSPVQMQDLGRLHAAAQWDFNQGSGANVADISGNNNGGVINGSTWEVGYDGAGMEFTSGAAFVNAGTNNTLDATSALTLTTWVKQSALPTGPQVILKKATPGEAGYMVEYSIAAGGYRMGVFISGAWRWSNAVSIPLDQWTHLAFTYDGAQINAYRNGVAVGAAVAQTGQIVASTNELWVGRDVANPLDVTRRFRGTLDDVRVYTRAISAAEVAAISAGNPAAQWTLDAGAGATAADVSGSGNTGTIIGATWGGGQSGGGLSFNGTGNYIDAGNGVGLRATTAITLAFWVKQAAAPTGPQTILKKAVAGQAGYTVEYSVAAGGYRMGLFIGGTWRWSNALTIDAGKWTHMSFTYDGSTIRAFKNGLAAGSAVEQTGHIAVAANNLWIARDVANANDANRYFNGALDDIRVYTRALNTGDILAIGATGPVANWKFDAGSGTTAVDSTGQNPPASINGATWIGGISGSALNFSGGAYVSQSNNALLNPTAAITVAVWIKQAAYPTTSQTIVKKAVAGQAGYTIEYSMAMGGYRMGLFIDGAWRWSNAVQAVAGQWTHLAFTYDGSQITPYVNGRWTGGAQAVTGAITPASADLWIGRDVANPSDANRYFNGGIDDVRIYDRCLSAAEVQQISLPPAIAQWNLDATGGTTATDSAGSNTGTLTGGTWVSGHLGNGLSLNGSSYVNCGTASALNPTTGITLSAVVKQDTLPTTAQTILKKATAGQSGYTLEYNVALGGYRIGLFIGGAWRFSGVATIDVGKWTMITGTYDGTTLSIYKNGVLVSSVAQTGTITTSANPLNIGRDVANPSDATRFFTGAIDDVRVYNVGLTDSQVNLLAQ